MLVVAKNLIRRATIEHWHSINAPQNFFYFAQQNALMRLKGFLRGHETLYVQAREPRSAAQSSTRKLAAQPLSNERSNSRLNRHGCAYGDVEDPKNQKKAPRLRYREDLTYPAFSGPSLPGGWVVEVLRTRKVPQF